MRATIKEIRAALDACNQGDARQRWQAQQHLLDEIDQSKTEQESQ
ncbi:hypothetical protein [Actinomyces succiniciruminis]|uniref:Uncharacterized protein n=1 Tax=Actinomyces succiniciruminis TaxID=1522002 RepID=A0A1L7RT86_9ACTO|nr:hypothetical protein [Actinomyces succiniciruminis]CED92443.1 Hypothetical protein AAM4_2611 [Actinomyces succiniciruminis]